MNRITPYRHEEVQVNVSQLKRLADAYFHDDGAQVLKITDELRDLKNGGPLEVRINEVRKDGKIKTFGW